MSRLQLQVSATHRLCVLREDPSLLLTGFSAGFNAKSQESCYAHTLAKARSSPQDHLGDIDPPFCLFPAPVVPQPPHPPHPRVSPGEQVGPEWKVLDFLDAAEKCLRDLRTQAAG